MIDVMTGPPEEFHRLSREPVREFEDIFDVLWGYNDAGFFEGFFDGDRGCGGEDFEEGFDFVHRCGGECYGVSRE